MTSLYPSSKVKNKDKDLCKPQVYKGIISVCNEGSALEVPIPSVSNQSFQTIPIASADIDITCFCSPKVKIDFNSIVNYQSLLIITGTPVIRIFTPLRVTFQLSRTNDSGSKVLLNSWTYSYSSSALASNTNGIFDFTYCDKNPCPGCYSYSVEIIRANYSLFGGVNTSVENFSIISSNISLLAFDSQ